MFATLKLNTSPDAEVTAHPPKFGPCGPPPFGPCEVVCVCGSFHEIDSS